MNKGNGHSIENPEKNDHWVELRSLLVGPEQNKLAELEKRLKDPDLLAEEISNVLPDAVGRTAKKSEALTTAFTPVVEKAVHESVKNNTKTFANILYPVIRPAIQKAIANAFKRMIQSFNKAVENSFSLKGIRWRFESLVTRKPFAEVVLLHSLVFDVDQVFLIQKQSGLLLHQVRSRLNVSRDGDLVSAMLKAIRDFVDDSFNVKENGLETIQVGDFSIWIEEGEFAVIAGVIRGNAPETLRSQLRTTLEKIEHQFRAEFEHFQGETSPFEKTGDLLESCLQTGVKQKKRRIPLVSWLLLVAIIGLSGFYIFSSIQEKQRWSSYLKKVESIPGVIITETGKKKGRFFIKGIRDPLSIDPVYLLSQYNLEADDVSAYWTYHHSLAPHHVLERAIAILKPPGSVTLELKDGVLTARGTASHQWIEEFALLSRGIPGIRQVRQQDLADLDLQGFYSLIKKIENQGIEFNASADEISPGQEQTVDTVVNDIKKLVTLSRELNQNIHIIINGHADSLGSDTLNRTLSTARADMFYRLLVSRNIPPRYFSARGLGSGAAGHRLVNFTILINHSSRFRGIK